MVENIKAFGAELKLQPLGQAKLTTKRHIHLAQWKVTNRIPTECALSTNCGNREGSGIDSPPAWIRRRKKINRHTWDEIWARYLLRVVKNEARPTNQVNGRRRADSNN